MTRSTSDRVRDGALRIASVREIPIYVHASWLVVFALIAWTLSEGFLSGPRLGRPAAPPWMEAFVASVILFASVLVHEIGHIVVSLRHGVAIRSVTLFVFGGVAQMEKDPEDGWTELKIAASGPAVSLALGSACYLAAVVSPLGDVGRAVAWCLAAVNLALGALNILPAFPLDGGRLLRALLWMRGTKRGATQIASAVATLIALGITFFGIFRLMAGDGVAALASVLIGWFLKNAAAATYERVRLDEALHGLAVRDAMLTEVATIPAHLALSDLAPEHVLRGGYHSYPVVRGEGVVGLLSMGQVLAVSHEERQRTSVQAIMTPLGAGISVGPGEPLTGALARMAQSGVGRLLVVEDGRLAGLLSLSSVFRHIQVREALSS
jgi:Zn-dependent protease